MRNQPLGAVVYGVELVRPIGVVLLDGQACASTIDCTRWKRPSASGRISAARLLIGPQCLRKTRSPTAAAIAAAAVSAAFDFE
jgi:hypothetical protein